MPFFWALRHSNHAMPTVGRNALPLGTPPFETNIETGGVRDRGGFHPTSQLKMVESATEADSPLQSPGAGTGGFHPTIH